MEIMEKIILIGITGTVCALILKKESPVFSLIISISAGLVIFFLVSDALSYAVMNVKTLFLNSNIDSEVISEVLKICAVGIVAEYFCSVISDTGETGIAKKVELGAKITIFAMTLPLIIRIMNSIWGAV